MPKRKLIRQSKYPYHVVTRTNNKNWFQIPIFEVWDICRECILYAQSKEPVVINCFLLMNNHYHLPVTTPNLNIDKFMMHFNWKLSDLISKYSGVITQNFSNSYRWTIVDKQSYLQNVYRYIYQNPVRADITESCISYPYSSLHFNKIESKKFNFKPHFNYSSSKSWFEKRYGCDYDSMIKVALKRPYFQPSSRASELHLSLIKTINN